MGRTMRSRGVSSYRSNKRSKRGNKLSRRLSKRRFKRSNKRSNRRLNRKSFKRVSKHKRNNRKNYKGGTPPKSPRMIMEEAAARVEAVRAADEQEKRQREEAMGGLRDGPGLTDIDYEKSKSVHPGDLNIGELYICVPGKMVLLNGREGPMFAGEPRIRVPDNKRAFGIKFLGRGGRNDRLYNIMYMTGKERGTESKMGEMGTTHFFFNYPYS